MSWPEPDSEWLPFLTWELTHEYRVRLRDQVAPYASGDVDVALQRIEQTGGTCHLMRYLRHKLPLESEIKDALTPIGELARQLREAIETLDHPFASELMLRFKMKLLNEGERSVGLGGRTRLDALRIELAALEETIYATEGRPLEAEQRVATRSLAGIWTDLTGQPAEVAQDPISEEWEVGPFADFVRLCFHAFGLETPSLRYYLRKK